MLTKQARERALLEVVYDDRDFEVIEHRDRPDFLLRHPNVDYCFGVEVTEAFETDSHARLHYHPEYIGRLFSGDRHMHRDDEREIPIEKVTIQDSTGNVKSEDVSAIIRPTLSARNRYAAIAHHLQEKEVKLANYEKDVGHVNLVIADQFGPPPETGSEDHYSIDELFVPTLRSTLKESDFREIYLVSMMKDGGIKYRPLQLLLLLESFFVFCRACAEFEDWPSGKYPENRDVAALFVWVQRQLGWDVELYNQDRSTVAARYRGGGVALGENSVEVFDFYDYSLPAAIDSTEPPVAKDVLQSFVSGYIEFVKANVFSCALFIPAKKTPDLPVISEGF